ncbi:hypothetical protein ABZT03_05335 [Streptomyces sp. NPDC005574]|uniref:hypothetical protein n=1 Tax=Streptomyces sp. NPDC005574 TaxID=3156891 RepID=UPI0033BC5CF7
MWTPIRQGGRRGAALLALMAVASCTQAHTTEREPPHSALPSVHAVPTLLDVGSLVLPIEPYLFTDRQVADLFRARAVLVSSCMRRFGHSWPLPTGTGPGTGTLNPANTAHRYGVTDAGKAARYGYHPAPGARPQSRKESPGPRPAPEEMLVLTGLGDDGAPARHDERGRPVPVGGCQGEATAFLSGDPRKIGNGELVGAINIGGYQDSQKDPRVAAVFRAWSRCMRRHGYRYTDPTRVPGNDPEFRGSTATRREITMAIADVTCKRETNTIGVWSSVDAACQRRAMGEKQRELAAVKRDMRRQLTNAAKVLRPR